MSDLVPLPINVKGPLDTTNYRSAVPTGTLVEAVDLDHRAMGPRRGRARTATALDVNSLSRTIYELNGTDEYWLHRYLSQQMVLSTGWTIDVVFEPTVVGSTSGTILSLGNSTHTDIQLFMVGTGGGANERKIRATVQASDSSGASGSAVTVTDSTQRTLAAAGTALANRAYVYHVRLIRNGAALSLTVNGTETTGTGLSTAKGHEYAHDGLYVGGHSTLANNYLGGWIYKIILRQGVFTDLRDAWLDPLHTRTPNVLLATTGGPPTLWVGSNTGQVQELSRFRNYGSVVNSPLTDTLTDFPFMAAIRGMGAYTDRYGAYRNLLVANGTLFHERVT